MSHLPSEAMVMISKIIENNPASIRNMVDVPSKEELEIRVISINEAIALLQQEVSNLNENLAVVPSALNSNIPFLPKHQLLFVVDTGELHIGLEGGSSKLLFNGVPGEKGDVGLTGSKGDKGDVGNQGIQGIQGQVGEKGDKGGKGDIGFQGIPGLKGDKGDTGLQGVQGLKGDTGLQGIQGIQGVKGDAGINATTTATATQTTNGLLSYIDKKKLDSLAVVVSIGSLSLPTIAAGVSASVTVPISPTLPNTNYSVGYSLEGGVSIGGLSVTRVITKNINSVVLEVKNTTLVSINLAGSINVIASTLSS